MRSFQSMTSLSWWLFQAGETNASLLVGRFASFVCLDLNRVIEMPMMSACLWVLDQNSAVLDVPGYSIAIQRGNPPTSVGSFSLAFYVDLFFFCDFLEAILHIHRTGFLTKSLQLFVVPIPGHRQQ